MRDLKKHAIEEYRELHKRESQHLSNSDSKNKKKRRKTNDLHLSSSSGQHLGGKPASKKRKSGKSTEELNSMNVDDLCKYIESQEKKK